MAQKHQISEKHGGIIKNNSRIVVIIAISSALAVFALVGGHSMLSRISYQRRVTTAQNKAIDQLKEDINSLSTLLTRYKVFNSANPNILGVKSSGSQGDEGTNARIVLDALPSQYDFPALTSSIEKILVGRQIQPQAIGGQDTSATANSGASSSAPQPQTMDFNFSVTTNYQNTKDLLADFQRSIRPFKVTSITLGGSNSVMTMAVNMTTYYQPSKSLSIQNMEIK